MQTLGTWLGVLGYSLLGLVALVVIGSPLLGGLLVEIDRCRLRAAARDATCPRCGATLGVESVTRADELWLRHMQARAARDPDLKLRLVRTLDAVCGRCGACYAFDPRRGFTATPRLEA